MIQVHKWDAHKVGWVRIHKAESLDELPDDIRIKCMLVDAADGNINNIGFRSNMQINGVTFYWLYLEGKKGWS